jgi:hypothetical protein
MALNPVSKQRNYDCDIRVGELRVKIVVKADSLLEAAQLATEKLAASIGATPRLTSVCAQYQSCDND